MRDSWATAFEASARAWWTPERTRQRLGDKQLLLMPAEAPTLLRALGLMNRNGDIPPGRMRKYRQINHLLRTVALDLEALTERFETVRLLDAGCGRSYVTLLAAWWFERIQQHPVAILGIDRSPEMIATCREQAQMAGLEGSLRFAAGELNDVDVPAVWEQAFGERADLHGLISLHACDTATDDALVIAVEQGLTFIAVAPCCQVELSTRWATEGDGRALGPVFDSPHLCRTAGATLTDAYRMQLLRAAGYHASAVEFVEAAHTPKNTLIRAWRAGAPSAEEAARYRALRDSTGGVDIALARRLGIPE